MIPAPRSISVVLGLLLIAPLSRAETAAPAPTPAQTAATLKAAGLTSAQLTQGVKTGLGTALEAVAGQLAQPGAFDLSGPGSLGRLQSLLARTGQSGALDGFKASLNQAASAVAPKATAMLKDQLKGFTVTNPAPLAAGQPGSATQALRQAAEPALRTQLLPLVNQALAGNGTVAKLKELVASAGPMAGMLGAPKPADLENYLVTQLLDTTFGALGRQEAALRANPAALKDKLAAKVFALGGGK